MSVKTRYGGAKEFPWEVYAKGQHIASVYGPGAGATAETMQANARLIAACPELLEACKGMLRLMKGLGYNFDAMEDAEAAIAKAEGRESHETT